jgi:integrase-like protein
VVLTPAELRIIIKQVDGVSRIVAQLLYGSGLRLLEALRLRVKDVDFARGEVAVRDPKGGRDRMTTLPRVIEVALRAHLEKVRLTHDADLALGFGSVVLPAAIGRKFPNADRAWVWQWIFPATTRYVDEESATERRRRPQTGHLPHVPPFIRHASSRARPGHSHGAGAIGPSRRDDDHDLHARPASRRKRGAQPIGCAVNGPPTRAAQQEATHGDRHHKTWTPNDMAALHTSRITRRHSIRPQYSA